MFRIPVNYVMNDNNIFEMFLEMIVFLNRFSDSIKLLFMSIIFLLDLGKYERMIHNKIF